MTETRIPVPTAAPTRPHPPLGVVVAMACLAQFMVVLDSTPGGFPELQPEDDGDDDLERLAAVDASSDGCC